MAKIRLYGVQQLDFYTAEGEHIEGVKIHYGYSSANVYGEKVETKFLSVPLLRKIGHNSQSLSELVGSDVNVDVDLSGHVIGISEVF